MKYYKLLLAFACLSLGISGCSRNHNTEILPPEPETALEVGMETEGLPPDTEIGNIHLFLFSSATQLLAEHRHFATMEQLEEELLSIPSGNYTLIMVVNAGPDFMPPSSRAARIATRAELPLITLADFAQWLSEQTTLLPEMLTGTVNVELKEGEKAKVIVTISIGASGVTLPTLQLALALPSPVLPPYSPALRTATRANAPYALRCVVEVCRTGTDEILHRRQIRFTLSDGTATSPYLLNLQLSESVYDLRLWMDYVRTDTPSAYTYYNTDKNLKTVSLNTAPYTANTDSKDSYYACLTEVSLPAEGTEREVELQRPLAKYRLVATDVEEYRKLAEEDTENYPPLEQLTVKVTYEGFFPSSFNVSTEKPNGAVSGNEISYSQLLATVADADKEVQIGSDWVLVNGTESFVTATVRMEDSDGKVISEKSGVRIDYRRGYLTTVKGKFLTAGHTGGGIHIDTGWEGSYEVRF